MIEKIENDRTTLDALERLRLALGDYSDDCGACVIMSNGATRINRLTEKVTQLQLQVKMLQAKNAALIGQQRAKERDDTNHVEYDDRDH